MSKENSIVNKAISWLKRKIQQRISIKYFGIIIFIILIPYFLQFINSQARNTSQTDFHRLLFNINSHFLPELEKEKISTDLIEEFNKKKIILSVNSSISNIKKEKEWIIEDNVKNNVFYIRKEDGNLNVYANTGLGISELISSVRQELREIENRRNENNETALFEVKDFDLEISFVVQSRSTLKGNIEYYFVTVDNEIETGQERIQKIKLHLTAIPKKHDSKKAADNPILKGKQNSLKILAPK